MFRDMGLPNLIFASFCFFWELSIVAGSSKQVGIEVGAQHLKVLSGDGLHLMRREQRSEDTQVPRTTTSTRLSINTAQAKPNVKLCACNGCFETTGKCRSIWFDQAPSSRGCASRNGTWCVDERTSIWEAPSIDCTISKRLNYRATTLSTLEVTLIALPGKGSVKFQMTANDDGNSSIALLPCTNSIPKVLLDKVGTSVLVQGYDEEDGPTVREILNQEGVPSNFKNNATVFIILNIQDTATVSSDVEKKTQNQVKSDNMAGVLEEHWSSQMTIAVALVSCPGTPLKVNRQKVKEAFFTEFAEALSEVSFGKIKVSGDVTDIVIACPANTSKGDVFSYYQAVNSGLRSNSIWTNNEYKAMVLPNGWMDTYGLAYSPGTLSWYTDLGAQDATNIMHEIGHNFGLDHAAIIPSNNPTGYDEHGDCSSAMSKCGKVLTYTLASSWFLGFNTFQQVIRMGDLSRVWVKVYSHSERQASGVLLTKKDKGNDVPAFTVSYLRKADVDPSVHSEMRNWIDKVHVHELPSTVYGATKSIAILNSKTHSAFHIRQYSVAISVVSQDANSATVYVCKVSSAEEALKCGKS